MNLEKKLVKIIRVGLVVLSLGLGAIQARAELDKKSEQKKIKSWTLAEWLAQKERNKMMDMWLVMHTPSPYEFALAYAQIGATQTLNLEEKEYQYTQASFMAYASLVGLEVQSENNSSLGYNDLTGIFHLRVFGAADQTSHLTFNFGQKSRQYKNNTGPKLRRQGLGEVDLTIYFNDYFGVQALYRSYLPITEDPDWGELSGSATEAGAFIDFEFLRVFLNYTSEKETSLVNGSQSQSSSSGTKAGVKLYF